MSVLVNNNARVASLSTLIRRGGNVCDYQHVFNALVARANMCAVRFDAIFLPFLKRSCDAGVILTSPSYTHKIINIYSFPSPSLVIILSFDTSDSIGKKRRDVGT